MGAVTSVEGKDFNTSEWFVDLQLQILGFVTLAEAFKKILSSEYQQLDGL